MASRPYNHNYYESHKEHMHELTAKWTQKHLDKVQEYRRTYYSKHKEAILKRTAESDRQLRLDALNHYGAKCSCCGETRMEFLALDHINGGGTSHRKEMHATTWRWLKKNHYPDGFRVLCHNCNMSLGMYGYCPHQI